MVKHGVYHRLKKKYLQTYKEKKAGALAATVANELFSVPPVDKEGKAFLGKNRELVDRKLSEIKNDSEIRKMVSEILTARVHVVARTQKSGDYDTKPGISVENLKKRGLYVKNSAALSDEQVISMAKRFYSVSLNL